MTFWSGEKLAVDLPSLIFPFSADQIDCASYRLRLGGEAFVTRDDLLGESPAKPLTQTLDVAPPRDKVVIPPGQFAFLLTMEIVRVPPNAMALISMRVSQKFKGLINVSGFHVDPGFSGNLLYSVYNAGPQPIILTRGEPLFIIVYADLDRFSDRYYTGSATGRTSIDADLIKGMMGQVFSPLLLQRQMKEDREQLRALGGQVDRLQSSRDLFKTVGISVIVAVLALFASVMLSDFVKAFIGGWVKGAIQLYDAPYRESQRSSETKPTPSSPSVVSSKSDEKPADRRAEQPSSPGPNVATVQSQAQSQSATKSQGQLKTGNDKTTPPQRQ